MNNEKIISEAVRQAQIISNCNGLKIGDIVAHPDEPITCELVEISGDMGVMEYKGIKRIFPLCEIFDVNIAYHIAMKILDNQLIANVEMTSLLWSVYK